MSIDIEKLQRVLADTATKRSPAERAAYLQQTCGDDPELLAEVQHLLTAHELAGDFLESSVITPQDLRPEGPGRVIGRYKILEQIGEGGFGTVYLAEQQEPVKRRVALKLIKLGMDTQQVVARFEAERQALALMDHPNVAKVFDAGATDNGRPFFVMELVRGVRITDYCDQHNLSTEQRLKLCLPVCHAIQHAHQKGIIHRDIKPSNILVTLADNLPVPKVIDFGIAKAIGERLTDKTLHTRIEEFLGTPAYTSPEQAGLGRLDVDTRTDIYSLGVLLYELLTGYTPFDSKEFARAGLDEIARRIREEEPLKPSTRLSRLEPKEQTTTAQRRATEPPRLIRSLRRDLDWIVMKCLEKDRARRYETANALAADLNRHLDNEPVVARPPTTAYRLEKACQRNKLVFTVAVAMVAALIVGIAISSWQAIAASRARNAEREARLAAQTERDKAQAAQKEAERSQAAEKSIRLEAEHQLYAAKMTQAKQAWDQNNGDLLRQLLEDTQDSPDRGFEWYYWQAQTHLALKTLRGHLERVDSVAFSPNGQRIVTGSDDNTARVWDAESGMELLTLSGHRARIRSVAFSPDGQRIVTGSHDNTVRVWEADSGREVLTLKGHSAQISSVAFSPKGQRIVTGSDDNTARVWEADSGREVLTLKGHSAQISSVAYSPDGQRIVTGSWDQTAKIWDAASGREVLTLKGHSDLLFSVAYSPDGQRIVTGSGDRTAKVWDAAIGSEVLTLKGHSGTILSVAFSPDGQRIVTGSWDGTARVWEAASGHEVLTLKGHSGSISSVAFSPDSRRIVSGSWDQTAKIWDVASGDGALTLKGHSDQVFSVAFSPDGQRIVTGSWDGTARVWEAASGRELLSLMNHGIEIASDWHVHGEGQSAMIWSVAFSPDGQRIVTGSSHGTAKLWEAASGHELLTLSGHKDWIISVAFSPDGRRIVTGSLDQTAKVWEAANGNELLTLKGHNSQVSCAAFSPDGQRMVTGSGDKTAKVWEASSGKELFTLKGHSSGVWSVAFSPDGQRIVTGSLDRTAKVWDASSGREVLTLKGHSGWVQGVAFSPNGKRIATSSDDSTAKLWEAATGRELLTLTGHRGGVESAAFSPDGQRIVTGSRDQTARVWSAATAKQMIAWQAEEIALAQHLAALQAERARSYIRHWLVLAPITLATGQSGAEGLDIEQIEGEASLRPRAGMARSIRGGELKWRAVALTNEVIDFNAILGHETTQSVAYAVCYIRSEAEHRGLRMLVGSDDEAKVYLNGKEVYKAAIARAFVADQHNVPDITLNSGLNVLVFKIVNETLDWQGSIRFTDALGQPLKGISVTLDPDASD